MSFLVGCQAGLSCRSLGETFLFANWLAVVARRLVGRPFRPLGLAVLFGLRQNVLLGHIVSGLSLLIRTAVLVSRYEDRLLYMICYSNWYMLSFVFCTLCQYLTLNRMNDPGRKGPCCFQRLNVLKCLKCQKNQNIYLILVQGVIFWIN